MRKKWLTVWAIVLAITMLSTSTVDAWRSLYGLYIVKPSGYPADYVLYGESTQLFFINYRQDGREDPIYNKVATFTSSNPSVGTINKDGVFTARDFGTTVVKATYGSLTASATITVPKPDRITFNDRPDLRVGERKSFKVYGHHNDYGSFEITDRVKVTSSNTSVLRIENGEFVARANGYATVTAKFEDKSVSMQVAVSENVNPKVNSQQREQIKIGFEYINDLRKRIGLAPLKEDAKLQASAQAHSDYLAQSDTPSREGHSEKAGNPGFTGESVGDRARYAGYSGPVGEVISYRNNEDNRGMKELIDAPYHRVLLIDSSAVDMGIGVSVEQSTNTVANIGFSSSAPQKNEIVYYPYPGQKDVVPYWDAYETPNPLAPFGMEGKRVGYPITISKSVLSEGTLSFVSAKITDSSGKEIDYYKTDHLNGHSYRTVILTPKQPLDTNMTYTVEFEGKIGSRTIKNKWTFTTEEAHFVSLVPSRYRVMMMTDETVQITVKATDYKGNVIDVTKEATYESSSKNIQVKNGVITATGAAEDAKITISYKGKRTIMNVTATVAESDDLTIPENVRLLTGKFPDVHGHWAEPVIAWAIKNNMVAGYEDGTFRPNARVTEAEFIAFMLRSFQVEGSFEAAKRGHWADELYRISRELDLPLRGYVVTDNRNEALIRVRAAEIIAALDGAKLEGNKAIQYLLDKGYSKGRTSATISGYDGEANITRAETIQFIYALKENGMKPRLK